MNTPVPERETQARRGVTRQFPVSSHYLSPRTGSRFLKFKVIIHAAEEGGFGATVPALPGCVSEGETREEILTNIREAIECYLDIPENDL